MKPTKSSSATAIATVSQTGKRDASQKPNTMKRMSDAELMTLSPK